MENHPHQLNNQQLQGMALLYFYNNLQILKNIPKLFRIRIKILILNLFNLNVMYVYTFNIPRILHPLVVVNVYKIRVDSGGLLVQIYPPLVLICYLSYIPQLIIYDKQ
jgi:hypothetical protein